MRVLLTGATGFIGTSLCEKLSKAGHELCAYTRDPFAAKIKLPPVKDTFEWPDTSQIPKLEAFDGVDAVVHLAGESVSGRWSPEKKRRVKESRVQGTRNLVSAIEKLDTKPSVLVSASAIGYYGDRDDQLLDEESGPGEDFFSEVCSEWEKEAARAEELGVRVVQLRFGIVIGEDGGALERILPMAKFGLNGPLGSGKQWWSWVHMDDVTGLIQHALEHSEVGGPVNATAPNPVQQKDFAKTLGKVLHRPAFLPAPAFALKLVLGEFSEELLSSKKTTAEKAKESGYQFKYPELEPALRETLE